MVFLYFIAFIVLLRIGELILSRSNEKWLLQNDAIEFGKAHYPFIVALHVLFIFSLIIEYYFRGTMAYSVLLLVIYFLLLLFKVWIILSLGKFWNTKIYRIPDVGLIKNGPYKYFKHPNYFVVVLEIVIIPLAFHLYYTAIIFSILNAIMLFIRIRIEDRALKMCE